MNPFLLMLCFNPLFIAVLYLVYRISRDYRTSQDGQIAAYVIVLVIILIFTGIIGSGLCAFVGSHIDYFITKP